MEGIIATCLPVGRQGFTKSKSFFSNYLRFMCDANNNAPELKIHLDLENAYLRFAGEALPDVVEDHLEACKALLRDFTAREKRMFHIEFCMIYFNTKVSRYFLEILRILDGYASKGNSVLVSWNSEVEDVDMHNAGTEFADELIHLTFVYGTFVSKQ